MTASIEEDVRAVGNISAVPEILEVVCQATGMGFAAVARVTEDRWVACAVLDRVNFGLQPGSELPIETTLCNEVRGQGHEIVIDHFAEDPDYAQHHTPRLYNLQSYISVPIVLPDGTFFGTLCAIDAAPAKLKSGTTLAVFKLFAQLLGRQIDDQRALARGEAALAHSKEIAEMRELFMAVLGHDLRNPLAAVQGGVSLLRREPQSPKSIKFLDLMQTATQRMSGLIDNMLDVARTRLGSGIALRREATRSLAETLGHVLDEARAGHPDREIDAQIRIDRPVAVDHARMAQLLSNLLANAVTHGSGSAPVLVDGAIVDGRLEISVANAGEPIPAAVRERLFQPYFRGGPSQSTEGLGLGLYIASQIAEAHGATLDVASDETETRFTFRLPLDD